MSNDLVPSRNALCDSCSFELCKNKKFFYQSFDFVVAMKWWKCVKHLLSEILVKKKILSRVFMIMRVNNNSVYR